MTDDDHAGTSPSSWAAVDEEARHEVKLTFPAKYSSARAHRRRS